MVQRGRISIAEHYHDKTKYSKNSVIPPSPLDSSEQHGLFKEFLSERAIDLVPFLPLENLRVPGRRRPARVPEVDESSELGRLARVLYFGYGVTGFAQTPTGTHLFRAAPSAGALYPAEVYVVTQGIAGLADGLHNYAVRHHQLVPVIDGEFAAELERICLGHPAVRQARATIIVTANYFRSAWRYRERCYRRALLDTGHVLGNICLYSPLERLLAVPIASFLDSDLDQLMFLDSDTENALVVVPLVPLEAESGDAELHAPVRGSPESSYSEEHEGSVMFQAFHRASSLSSDRAIRQGTRLDRGARITGESIPLAGTLSDLGSQLPAVILRRRSTRFFSGESIPFESLSRVLSYASTLQTVSSRRYTQISELLDTYVIARDVDGLHPGVYRFRMGDKDLLLERAGDQGDAVYHFCMEQKLGADAAATVVHTAHLRRAIEHFGDRAYRYLHMDAGLLGQAMNLAALQLGVGVSGIGGFFDDEVNALLQLSLDHIVVYVTVLGVPEPVT